MTLFDRFRRRVDKRGPDECWPWLGGTTKGGYGLIGLGRKKLIYTHRLALQIATGEDRPSEDSCHTCDNPPCCNPKHLYWGNATSNMRDAMERGRYKPPPGASLATSDVAEIRRLRAQGVSRRVVASQFSVSVTSVSNITTGHTWRVAP